MDRKCIEIKMIPVKWLVYFDRNINVLSSKKMNDLEESIEAEGIKEPLMIAENKSDKESSYTVLDGNHRLRIAKKLKILEVPCIIKEISEEKFFHEHLLLNYYRGEVSTQRLCGYIKDALDNGIPIKQLAKQFSMSEGWILKHYEMSTLDFNEAEFKKSLSDENMIMTPIFLKGKVIDKIFKIILEKDKHILKGFLEANIRRHKRAIQKMGRKVMFLANMIDKTKIILQWSESNNEIQKTSDGKGQETA